MERLRNPLRLAFGALGVLMGVVIGAVVSDFWWRFVVGCGIVAGLLALLAAYHNEQWDTVPRRRGFILMAVIASVVIASAGLFLAVA